ncbi:MAG: alpha/beta hydrolase [Opitutaceae bacterium]
MRWIFSTLALLGAIALSFSRRLAAGTDGGYVYSAPIEPSFRDLAYADKSPSERLDLYVPTREKERAPLVIWIHGGAFLVGDKKSMPRRNFGPPPVQRGPMGPFQIQVPDVAALVAKGYAVVSLNYRLEGGFRQGNVLGVVHATQDAKAAVRFLRANALKYGLDPARFAVWGNSAGGYMATMLGLTGDRHSVFDEGALGNAGVSSAVQAVVVWYGAVAVQGTYFPEYVRMSSYLLAGQTYPPFLIANGDADLNVSLADAEAMQSLFLQAGVKSTLTVVPEAKHEDPAFMKTQMLPTFDFLDRVFGRSKE